MSRPTISHPSTRRAAAALAVLAAIVLAGCAGTPKTADAKDATEYEYVYVVGSNLPVKVPKKRPGEIANATSSTVTSGEALRDISSRTTIKNPKVNGPN